MGFFQIVAQNSEEYSRGGSFTQLRNAKLQPLR